MAIVVEHNQIELDYCVRCRGVWFDAGELELLLASIQRQKAGFSMDYLLSQPQAQTRERKRQCPICQKTMRKLIIGDSPEILIDICPDGHGLWFDGGEFDQLVKQLSHGSPDPVISFLGEAFQAR
jgi:uncharacterized protein